MSQTLGARLSDRFIAAPRPHRAGIPQQPRSRARRALRCAHTLGAAPGVLWQQRLALLRVWLRAARAPPASLPQAAQAIAIADLFGRRLTADNIAAECAYFAVPTARGFERPYGWGWLLKLAEALAPLPELRWSHALAPLTDMVVQRVHAFLPLAVYPSRVGTHYNIAFALRLAADHVACTADADLIALLRDTGGRFFAKIATAPAEANLAAQDDRSTVIRLPRRISR